MRIVAYHVVLGLDGSDLERRVQHAIEAGWQPQGGGFTVASGNLAQAVVRYEAPRVANIGPRP